MAVGFETSTFNSLLKSVSDTFSGVEVNLFNNWTSFTLRFNSFATSLIGKFSTLDIILDWTEPDSK